MLAQSLADLHSQRNSQNINSLLTVGPGTFGCHPKRLPFTGVRLRVYLDFCDHADNETGGSYWFQKNIAERLGCSLPSVEKAVRWLRTEGWISRYRYRRGGRGNLYIRHFQPVTRTETAVEKVAEVASDTRNPVRVSPVKFYGSTELDSLNETQGEPKAFAFVSAELVAENAPPSGSERGHHQHNHPQPRQRRHRSVKQAAVGLMAALGILRWMGWRVCRLYEDAIRAWLDMHPGRWPEEAVPALVKLWKAYRADGGLASPRTFFGESFRWKELEEDAAELAATVAHEREQDRQRAATPEARSPEPAAAAAEDVDPAYRRKQDREREAVRQGQEAKNRADQGQTRELWDAFDFRRELYGQWLYRGHVCRSDEDFARACGSQRPEVEP